NGTVMLIGLAPGVAAAVVFQTTVGFETISCPPAPVSGPTVCQGTTVGAVLIGSVLQVLVNGVVVAQGTVGGTSQAASTATALVVGSATRTPTGAPTPTASAT